VPRIGVRSLCWFTFDHIGEVNNIVVCYFAYEVVASRYAGPLPERLQRAVAGANLAAKEAERRMYAIMGEALLAEAETDAALKARIVEMLRHRVTCTTAKADIAALLAG
jgi:hypothetical protein